MLQHSFQDKWLEAGVDEAGRGCFAGPVVAAAVILPPHFSHPELTDSKQLSASKRTALQPIIEAEALAFAVIRIEAEAIDRINILQATYAAMHQAIQSLAVTPELLLIDGNRFKPYPGIPHQCMVKGDGRFLHIAAASILAKTYRDAWMEELHAQYPAYGWNQNKGYGTVQHRKAMEKFGLTPHHRRSFQWKNESPSLFDELEKD